MRLFEIVNYLNDMYSLDSFEESDNSISKRFSLFPTCIYNSFEKDFITRSNGLLFNNGEEVQSIVFACFLSNFIWKSLEESNLRDAIIITHHIYDIDAGDPFGGVGEGFSTISAEFFQWLRAHRISAYALHLPLDMNEKLINNHNSFCEKLCIKITNSLLDFKRYTMGYLGEIEYCDFCNIRKIFKRVATYGKSLPERETYNVAVLAGMISSVEMLKEISTHSIDVLICGDVLLRNGSERMRIIERYLFEECPYHIICVSHQWSEEIGLLKLMNHLEDNIKDVMFYFVNGEDRWK